MELVGEPRYRVFRLYMAGATFGFSPNPVAGAGSSTLTVKTAKTTPVGSRSLLVTGSSGSLSHSQSVELVVR